MKFMKLRLITAILFLPILLGSAQSNEMKASIPEALLVSLLNETPQELSAKRTTLDPKKDEQTIAAIDLLLNKLHSSESSTTEGLKAREWFVNNKATDWIVHLLADLHARTEGVQLLVRMGDGRAVPPMLNTLESAVQPITIEELNESGSQMVEKLQFKKEAIKAVEKLIGIDLVDEEKLFVVYNLYMTSPDQVSGKTLSDVVRPSNLEKLNADIRQFIVDARKEWKAQSVAK